MANPDPAPSLESLLLHSDWLTALARRLVVDRSTADDVAQDAWVAALRNPPRERHSIRAWLTRVVRRLARGRGPSRERHAELARDDAPPTDEVVARIEQERLLARLVLELEEPYRTVVLQRFYGGLTAARIARIENVPQATVRTRVRRALALLRERLEREGEDGGGAWPLSAILLARDAWNLHPETNGVVLMGTKSTIAVSVASGVLCTIAVTEGILPRFDSRTAAEHSTSVAARAVGALDAPALAVQDARAGGALVAEQDHAPSGNRRSPAPARTIELSPEELRTMLFSSDRLEQVRAIQLLLQRGSEADNRVLVEAFLASKDRVLSSLIEEALLTAPETFAPAVLAAFETGDDPQTLARLGDLLAAFVEKRPELEKDVVAGLIDAWQDPDASPDRAGAATGALQRLGVRAADEVAEYMADARTGPKGAGSAAWLIAQLPAENGELVREKLGEGLRSLENIDDTQLSEEERTAMREKTGSVAWATSLRPEEEHDRLGREIFQSLLRTNDKAQAGTLAWSLGNLKGLTDGARVDMSREILGALSGQSDAALQKQYVSMVKTLARPGASTDEIVRLVQVERGLQTAGSPLAQALDALLAALQAQ